MNNGAETIFNKPLPTRSQASRAKLSAVLRASRGTISVEQAAGALEVPNNDAAKTLARWAKQGWVSRVRRGLYVPIPLANGSNEVALEDAWLVADRLFSPCYVGGWSAAEHWGLTEQIYRSILVMTTKKPRDRKPVIKGSSFVLRTIQADTFFGTKAVWRGQSKVAVSDPSRTVLDMMDDPLLGGGIRPSADVLQTYLESEHKNLGLLIEYAMRLGSGAAVKRLGFLLERHAPTEIESINQCRAHLTQGNVKLDPSLPSRRMVSAWRLWVPENWKGASHD